MAYDPDWLAQQQPSSWRGIPIVVTSIDTREGRRKAIHEYPFYDYPWVQDLGKATEEFSVEAFIWGDDVIDQYEEIRNATSADGSAGEFVDPMIGSIQVDCIAFSNNRSLEGNVVQLRFTFVSQGPVNSASQTSSLAPYTSVDTQAATTSAATEMDSASSEDFFDEVGSTIHTGISAVRQVTTTINQFTSQVQSVVGDATRAVNAVNGLASVLGGNVTLGRYNQGNLSVVPAALQGVNLGISTINRVTNGTAALLSAACAARTTVTNSIDNVSSLLGGL